MRITAKKDYKPTWITDGNGNRASVEYWGGKKAAQQSLETLTDCWDCENCEYCDRCWQCIQSVECAQCDLAVDCERCQWCWGCAKIKDGLWCGPYGRFEGVPKIPVIENIHTAVYVAASAPGALDMSAWHSCPFGTRHCWGGWIISLAGKAGESLASFCGPMLAAMAIADASGYRVTPSQFFASEEEALADMRCLAETGCSGNV